MKSHELLSVDEIVRAFGGFNFGVKTPEQKVSTLYRGLLQAVSGYSVGSSMREVLVRLGLARYQKGSLYINVTAYGQRCVLSAHDTLVGHKKAEIPDSKRPLADAAG